MGVVRFDLSVAGFPAFSCAGVVVEPVDPVHALGDLTAIASARAWQPGASEMALRPEGLAAEVTSRPGREVWAWIARERARESRPVGFVALVRAGTLAVPRWSIGWLVVDPAARRRGIGTALVATAVRFAGARGARVVHAETLDRWPAAVAFWAAARLAALGDLATLQGSGESRKTAEG
jgi:GNAT superfamily N-acetyltransferase